MSDTQEHIIMLPFLALGHMIPFLALANKIQERTNYKITIVSTPLNIKYLSSNRQNPNNISLVSLPYNSFDLGLPPNTENTEALPLKDMVTIFNSTLSLKDPLKKLILEIIKKDGFDENSCIFNVSQLHPFMKLANGNDSWSKILKSMLLPSLDSLGWLCNSVEEIEFIGIKAIKNLTKLPVWCIGPLLPQCMIKKGEKDQILESRIAKDHGLSPEKCIEWLNKHPKNSVLYISFGSQNTISTSQMMALALGLEDSEKPFIWVVRPPIGFDLKGEFKSEWLPQGFQERVEKGNKGLIVKSWAPQLQILCHGSTGAFLTHCGWNSVLESLSEGVPIISWPLAGEQAFNSKMLMEEMGVCIELTKGVESVIEKDDVKKVIDVVLSTSGKGKEMKERANEIGISIREAVKEEGKFKGSSVKAMDDFISTLLCTRNLSS
ncbi:UDP-glycosyltransferase 92A1-like isoform X3 [Nicotiana tabacum]|uniref:Glycosyltransferase n=1 Tax=Nicotiana tabacum TaxID=4097 RepID=A0A1S3YL39_TOBAC|nr:PREDICTED: UDP-glycosyltransferase 92A1-like isoform X3 [Nicotiana tabacum]